MARAHVLIVLAVVAPGSSCLSGDESLPPLPPCVEGCVADPCAADYFGMPAPPHVGSRFPVLRELGSPDCEPRALDDAGRVIEYLCFGAATTIVSYVGDTELPQTIVQTDTIRDGTVEQELRFEMTWSERGELTSESVRSFLDGVWEGNEVAFETVFAEDGAVVETHERTRFPEGGDPGEAGNHHEPFFTDDRVERAHRTQRWLPDGRLERDELRAGLAETLALEAVYTWSDVGLAAVTVVRRVDASAEQAGCTKPDPEHIECTAELRYDDAGVLVSFVEAGTEYTVSDTCCGACAP